MAASAKSILLAAILGLMASMPLLAQETGVTATTVAVSGESVGTLALGLGWNWQYIRGDFPDWSDEEWRAFHALLQWSGAQMVRYGLDCDQWEPQNDDGDPHHLNWPGFAFDNAVMRGHYRNLDFCEKAGIDVLVCNWDSGSDRNWLSETVHDPNLKDTDGNSATDAPYSPDEFVESICALIHQLKVVKGYDCVKYVSLWNEPNGGWAYNSPNARYPDTFWPYYRLLDQRLRELGLRERIKILAPDTSYNYRDKLQVLEHLRRFGFRPDVVCDHDYDGFTETLKPEWGTPLSEGIPVYRQLLAGLRAIYGGRPAPFLIGEFGNCGRGSQGVSGDRNVWLGAISTSELVLRALQEGVAGALRWEFRPYGGGGWENFGALTSADREFVFRPYRPPYYAQSILARWSPQGSTILRTTVAGGRDAAGLQHVWACALRAPSGQRTVLLINDALESVECSVPAARGTKWLYYDATLPAGIQVGQADEVGQGLLRCRLSPLSINCFTTIRAGTSEPDLSEAERLGVRRQEPVYTQADGQEQASFDFEQGLTWSYWRYPGGNSAITRSDEQRHGGRYAARFFYDFTRPEKLEQREHVIAFTELTLNGPVRQVSVWVYGDGSGHDLHINFTDADGEVFDTSLTVLDFSGWRHIVRDFADFPAGLGHWGGNNDGRATYPLRRLGLGLTERDDAYTGQGALYLDDLIIRAGP